MQRKRHINFKDKGLNSSSSGRLSSILHSIPILLNMKNKSNVLYSIPCVKSCACTFCILLVLGFLSVVVGSGSCYAASASLTLGTTGTISSNATAGSVAYVSNTITASASDVSSYSLTITGPTNLITEGSSGSGSSGTTITGANNNKPSTMPNNSWGYSYNEDALSNDNKTYKSFTGSAQTLESGTTPSNTAKNITFAAKFGEDAISGHYKANIILSLVATPTATTRTLTYNANSGSPTPAAQTCADYGDGCTITMSYTTPTRSGYTFKGWGDSTSTVNSNYGSGKTITLTANKTIYAVWQANGANWSDGTSSGITYMQDITTGTGTNSFCKSSLPTHASITLKDKRDESSYTIVKMADGKCWMTSNLKIVNKTITSADSDVSSSFTIPASSISGFSSNTASNAYVSGNTGYYTWCAATAGTCSSATSDGSNASSSICPKNWKLPTGGSSTSTSDFGKFASAEGIANSSAGSTKIQGSPYNFPYTGYVYDGSLINTTTNGFWWSRTANNSNNAYLLYINSTSVYPGTTNYYHYGGSAVRCVAQ